MSSLYLCRFNNETLILELTDLLHNRIGNEGGSLLLPALRENKQLTEFKVDTQMDEELFKALFRSSATSKKGKAKKGKAKKKK